MWCSVCKKFRGTVCLPRIRNSAWITHLSEAHDSVVVGSDLRGTFSRRLRLANAAGRSFEEPMKYRFALRLAFLLAFAASASGFDSDPLSFQVTTYRDNYGVPHIIG